MPSTSHPEFGTNTEALEVAEAFARGIRNRTVIVTGVNRNGIGFTTAQAITSQSPAHLIIAGRNLSRLQDSIDTINAQFPNVDCRLLQINLSSQKSVRAAAAQLMVWTDVPTVDIVVNSAGIMYLPERTLNEDGIEMTFATNHIGHYLLVCLIMPKLIKAAENSPKGSTRIINVSAMSPLFSSMRWSDMNFDKKSSELPEAERPSPQMHARWGNMDVLRKSYIPLEAYNQSKVANVLFSIGLTEKLYHKHGILSLALHPGVIQTELIRNMTPETLTQVQRMRDSGIITYKSLEAGSSTSLVAALDPKLGPGEFRDGKENYGTFLADCQINHMTNPPAVSSAEAGKLWTLSEELVNERFDW